MAIFDPGTPLKMIGEPFRFIWTEFQPVISYDGPTSVICYVLEVGDHFFEAQCAQINLTFTNQSVYVFLFGGGGPFL